MKHALVLLLSGVIAPHGAESGFASLFNGKDLTRWIVPEGDNGRWKVLDGVIDYDARSEQKNLWWVKAYGDFILKIDRLLKPTSGLYPMPIVWPNGSHKRAAVTPKVCADKPVGGCNTFVITMKSHRVTIALNSQTVAEDAQPPNVHPQRKSMP